MTSRPEFSPILSRHAIERCAASVGFTPQLPLKAFERLKTKLTDALVLMGFSAQKTVQIGFSVGPDGTMTPASPSGLPIIFLSSNQTITITIGADGVVWTNTNYVRWQPYIGEFERIVLPLLEDYLDLVSISGVKLEYWDRFIWSGDWGNFDAKSLIKTGSRFVAQEAASKQKQWHSHTGWFEPEGAFRRLVNANVEVAEIVSDPTIAPRPSIGIYTMITDQTNAEGYGTIDVSTLDRQFIIDRLENQHLALKGILGHIIEDSMANRIGLFSRNPNK